MFSTFCYVTELFLNRLEYLFSTQNVIKTGQKKYLERFDFFFIAKQVNLEAALAEIPALSPWVLDVERMFTYCFLSYSFVILAVGFRSLLSWKNCFLSPESRETLPPVFLRNFSLNT
ncbi:hypothetical protein ILYODFUR_008879 [Ilyodon furcidens]|uniref:Uncharacterized protein n=1 Tax=Ilyodon furcidens TaxID=33524 RepID=A0ABV0V557_9TELE